MLAAIVDAAGRVDPVPGIDTSSIIVAVVTATAGFGGAFLMFRGKTQDTANWLVLQLREETRLAREAAYDARQLFEQCEAHREEDRALHEMELDELRTELAQLRKQIRKGTSQ